MVENDEPVDGGDHRVHRVFYHQNCDPVGAQAPDERDQLIGLIGGQPRQGFVHQDQLRPARQGACELHEAKLLGREPARRSLRAMGHANPRQSAFRRDPRLGVRDMRDISPDDDVLDQRHARERAHGLESARDARATEPVRLQPRHIAAFEQNVSFAWRGHAVEQVEQRRLACAVRADHADDFAAPDLEIDAGDSAKAAIFLRQIHSRKQRLALRRRFARREGGLRRLGKRKTLLSRRMNRSTKRQ